MSPSPSTAPPLPGESVPSQSCSVPTVAVLYYSTPCQEQGTIHVQCNRYASEFYMEYQVASMRTHNSVEGETRYDRVLDSVKGGNLGW